MAACWVLPLPICSVLLTPTALRGDDVIFIHHGSRENYSCSSNYAYMEVRCIYVPQTKKTG